MFWSDIFLLVFWLVMVLVACLVIFKKKAYWYNIQDDEEITDLDSFTKQYGKFLLVNSSLLAGAMYLDFHTELSVLFILFPPLLIYAIYSRIKIRKKFVKKIKQ